MNFWEQFAIYQASAALNTLLVRYGRKYLRPEETAAAMLLIAMLADLPQRIQSGGPGAALEPPDAQMFIKQE